MRRNPQQTLVEDQSNMESNGIMKWRNELVGTSGNNRIRSFSHPWIDRRPTDPHRLCSSGDSSGHPIFRGNHRPDSSIYIHPSFLA
mmetsp:Transcript_993/g.2125  ORF Transcript_993/g.2125 Transcript_993/m.2125 type:complete len:86 (-) Transcript_993:125-382(-)